MCIHGPVCGMKACMYVCMYTPTQVNICTHTHRRVCVTIVIENGSYFINIASINPLWRPQVGGQLQRSALTLHSQQGSTEAESTLKAQRLCVVSVDVLQRAGVLTAANVLAWDLQSRFQTRPAPDPVDLGLSQCPSSHADDQPEA